MNKASNSVAPQLARQKFSAAGEAGTRIDRESPRVLLSGTIVNRNVRNAVLGLAENDLLAEFWTLFSWDPESNWNRLLPRSLRTQLARRSFIEAPRGRVKTVPWREVVRAGLAGTAMGAIFCSGERPFSAIGTNRHFDRRVARRVRELRPDIAYAYEGCALLTFREAQRLGVVRCYELPSSYWYWEHRFLSEEAERNPGFAGLLPKLMDSPGHMQWKDEELSLADYVFVPSEHVLETLAGVVPRERIRVIPYGAPAVAPRADFNLNPAVPLRVLFAGALVQRKGISYLLEAVERLGPRVELTLVGRRFGANAKVDEACRRWRWFESLPHAQVLDIMRQSDVLVLPSLAEGCALVVLEALACGLPVIVTPNTGSLAFVRDGQEGFVVPICSAEAIAERLEVLERDRGMLVEMSRRAQATAAENSWEHYRANWADAVRSLAWH